MKHSKTTLLLRMKVIQHLHKVMLMPSTTVAMMTSHEGLRKTNPSLLHQLNLTFQTSPIQLSIRLIHLSLSRWLRMSFPIDLTIYPGDGLQEKESTMPFLLHFRVGKTPKVQEHLANQTSIPTLEFVLQHQHRGR